MLDKNKILHFVERSSLSKRQVAIKAGINTQNFYRFLNGKLRSMDVTTAFKLADALEVDINEFREEK